MGRGRTLGTPQVGVGARSDHVLRTVIQIMVIPGANVKWYKITCSENYVFVSPPVLSTWLPSHYGRPQMLVACCASSWRRGIVTPSACPSARPPGPPAPRARPLLVHSGPGASCTNTEGCTVFRGPYPGLTLQEASFQPVSSATGMNICKISS